MKIIIPLMALLLFVGICFTAHSENPVNNESNIPTHLISDFFQLPKAPFFVKRTTIQDYRKPNDAESSISELRHTKTSSDHQIYFLRNIHNNKFVWSYDPITVVDNDKIFIQEEPSFSEIINNLFFHVIMRYTLFLALGLLTIMCLRIWLIPLMVLRDFYRFINRRLKMVRT